MTNQTEAALDTNVKENMLFLSVLSFPLEYICFREHAEALMALAGGRYVLWFCILPQLALNGKEIFRPYGEGEIWSSCGLTSL